MTENKSPWADDLFDRAKEADDLIRYIRSAYEHGSFVGEERSQVIAIDADYGIGKSFFLKRLAKQLDATSPVAYIDAWADDFVGQPIISLAATLRQAIEPTARDPQRNGKWAEFARKTGKIAWIGSKGLGKQALKLAISSGAVEGIEAVIGETNRFDSKEVKDAISEAIDGTLDADTEQPNSEAARHFLESQIKEYEDAKRAVKQVRASLTEFAASVIHGGKRLPIFVIIDELDRCNPHYSVKVLEGIKHLFSVPEVYFILGLNSRQLASSIAHAYGSSFDSVRYLDRFIDRSYNLSYTKTEVLVDRLYKDVTNGTTKELWFPQIGTVDGRVNLTKEVWISRLLEFYQISPRGVFRFFDRLRTALAIIQYRVVPMPYLCELIARDLGTPRPDAQQDWKFYFHGGMGGQGEWYDRGSLFDRMYGVYRDGRRDAERQLQNDTPSNRLLWEFMGSPQEPGVEDYINVLKRLTNFSDLTEA